jgi:PAS domain S-box-containing protein
VEDPRHWMELVPIPMYQTDRSGAFVYVNAAWVAMTGLQSTSVVGRKPYEISGWKDDVRIREFDRALIAGENQEIAFTRSIPRIGKEPVTAVVTQKPLLDQSGTVIGVVGAVVDIQERLNSARVVREQKERLDLVVHASQSGIFDVHLPNGDAYVSPRLCAILGHRIDWRPNIQTVRNDVHPDDWAYVASQMQAHFSRQIDRVEIEYRHRCADGTFIHVEVHAIATNDDQGQRLTGSIINVEEKHCALREAAHQRAVITNVLARLDHVINVSGHGVWDRNLKTGEFWCTPRFKEILGYSSDDDMSDYQFGPQIHPDDRERVVLARERHLRGLTDTFDEEFRRLRPNGEIIWIRSRGRILEDRWVGSIIETTPDRAREAALREAKEQAEAAVQAKAAFLSTMSHEIRTPLNGVLGANSLLSTTQLSDEQKRYVEIVETCGDALLSLISDILDFSRIESGRIDLERRQVSLAKLVESTFEIIASQARDKSIDLIADLDPLLPRSVLADEAKLRQILINLVGNAVKFTPSGYVRVSLSALPVESAAGNEIVITAHVSDTGIGVPEAARGTLFEPFLQGDTSIQRRYGGSGLGLAICRKLIERMGGTIELVDTGEHVSGSTFRFTVCVERDPDDSIDGRSFVDSDLADVRVLLVHPTPEAREHYKRLLQNWKMDVYVATSVAEAMQLAALHPVDVGLTDIDQDTHGNNGWTNKQVVDVRGHRVPLVALTNVSVSEYQAREGAVEYAGFILKPASRSQLYEGLQRVIFRRRYGMVEEDFPLESVAHICKSQSSILLVEDNAINQLVAREMLRQLGFACDVVDNGRDALQAVLTGSYEVVLMDIQMPDMNGKDAAWQIVQQVPIQSRPVIIALTAHAIADDLDECRAVGMEDYITKPVRRETLAKAIQAALELRQSRKT